MDKPANEMRPGYPTLYRLVSDIGISETMAALSEVIQCKAGEAAGNTFEQASWQRFGQFVATLPKPDSDCDR